jgi:hypothetical protein
MSIVYSWAPDVLYDLKLNGSMTKWAKRNKLNIVRYPGGVASAWDWEKPTGYMGYSGLNEGNPPDAPAANWMSMAEYLEVCREINSRPLIGVNYNCHNYKNCDQNVDRNVSATASIARAVRQVQFAVKQGFPGSFYYIGNEECQESCVGDHADLIARHAKAMKAVDPTMKTLWNENEIKPGYLAGFLKQVGPELMDGVDLHGKWPHGGPDKKNKGMACKRDAVLQRVPKGCSVTACAKGMQCYSVCKRDAVLQRVPKGCSVTTCIYCSNIHYLRPDFSPGTTFEEYCSEVPLKDHKCGETWRERIAGLRNVSNAHGEWAINRGSTVDPTHMVSGLLIEVVVWIQRTW